MPIVELGRSPDIGLLHDHLAVYECKQRRGAFQSSRTRANSCGSPAPMLG